MTLDRHFYQSSQDADDLILAKLGLRVVGLEVVSSNIAAQLFSPAAMFIPPTDSFPWLKLNPHL